MNMISEDFKSWLLSCIGLRLTLVLGLFHVFELKKNSSPQAVSLLFDQAKIGTLMCASDGSSIAHSSDRVVECSLGEYGSEEVFSLDNDAVFSSVMGRELVSVFLMHSSIEESIIGVVFDFGKSDFFSLINLGDDLFIYKEISSEIVSCQEIEFIKLS